MRILFLVTGFRSFYAFITFAWLLSFNTALFAEDCGENLGRLFEVDSDGFQFVGEQAFLKSSEIEKLEEKLRLQPLKLLESQLAKNSPGNMDFYLDWLVFIDSQIQSNSVLSDYYPRLRTKILDRAKKLLRYSFDKLKTEGDIFEQHYSLSRIAQATEYSDLSHDAMSYLLSLWEARLDLASQEIVSRTIEARYFRVMEHQAKRGGGARLPDDRLHDFWRSRLKREEIELLERFQKILESLGLNEGEIKRAVSSATDVPEEIFANSAIRESRAFGINPHLAKLLYPYPVAIPDLYQPDKNNDRLISSPVLYFLRAPEALVDEDLSLLDRLLFIQVNMLRVLETLRTDDLQEFAKYSLNTVHRLETELLHQDDERTSKVRKLKIGESSLIEAAIYEAIQAERDDHPERLKQIKVWIASQLSREETETVFSHLLLLQPDSKIPMPEVLEELRLENATPSREKIPSIYQRAIEILRKRGVSKQTAARFSDAPLFDQVAVIEKLSEKENPLSLLEWLNIQVEIDSSSRREYRLEGNDGGSSLADKVVPLFIQSIHNLETPHHDFHFKKLKPAERAMAAIQTGYFIRNARLNSASFFEIEEYALKLSQNSNFYTRFLGQFILHQIVLSKRASPYLRQSLSRRLLLQDEGWISPTFTHDELRQEEDLVPDRRLSFDSSPSRIQNLSSKISKLTSPLTSEAVFVSITEEVIEQLESSYFVETGELFTLRMKIEESLKEDLFAGQHIALVRVLSLIDFSIQRSVDFNRLYGPSRKAAFHRKESLLNLIYAAELPFSFAKVSEVLESLPHFELPLEEIEQLVEERRQADQDEKPELALWHLASNHSHYDADIHKASLIDRGLGIHALSLQFLQWIGASERSPVAKAFRRHQRELLSWEDALKLLEWSQGSSTLVSIAYDLKSLPVNSATPDVFQIQLRRYATAYFVYLQETSNKSDEAAEREEAEKMLKVLNLKLPSV